MPEVTEPESTENEEGPRTHEYHAEATVLTGDLKLPLMQVIEPQGFAALAPTGGYLTHQLDGYKFESVLSYRSAYTQVAGNEEVKVGRGWNTLATAVIEGLNILDVLTVERVVAQVSLEYPRRGYVPHITFLGTRFDNLRIAGHEIKLDLDLNICGPKPDGDQPYTRSPHFVDRVSAQHARLRELHGKRTNPIAGLLDWIGRSPESFENAEGTAEEAHFSLANGLLDAEKATFPGHNLGHVFDIPNFGIIHFAALHLRHFDYKPGTRIPRKTKVHLNMIEADLGCIGNGKTTGPTSITNGTTSP